MVSAVQEEKSQSGLSNLPVFQPKFQDTFDKCETGIREIFLALVNRFVEYPLSLRSKTVNRPDYRFAKKYVFCAIQLQRKCLLVTLRVDNYNISSELLTLETNKDKSRPGNRWLDFRLHNEDQLDEAYRLIDEVYRFTD